MEPKHTRNSPRLTPCCGYLVDCSAPSPGEPDQQAVAEAGDVSACFNCGTWLVFTDKEGGLRKMTDREKRKLHPESLRELCRLTSMIKKLGPPPSVRQRKFS